MNTTSSQSQVGRQGILQMALPQFSLPQNNQNGINQQQKQSQGIPLIPQIPQIPHNLFKTNSSISIQSTNSNNSLFSAQHSQFGTPPQRKRMKLNPNMDSTLPLNFDTEQTEKDDIESKCRLMPSSRGIIQCIIYTMCAFITRY